MDEIEVVRKRRKFTNNLWQATVVFTLFETLLSWTEADKPFTLCQIAAFVGSIVMGRPKFRVVLNLYNSWRLTRAFKPLYRGRAYHDIMDDYPMVKRKAIKWTRRRIVKRKKDEEEITALEFMKKMNAWFVQYDVFKVPGEHLKWSENTACRYMHRLC